MEEDREIRTVWNSFQLVSTTHGFKINDREMFMKGIRLFLLL